MINPSDKNYAAIKMTIQKRATKKVLMELFLEQGLYPYDDLNSLKYV